MTTQKIRVMLVDDSVVVRRVMTDLLKTDPEIDVVATAATGQIALTRLASTELDIVILDLDLPGMGGLETLRALKELAPNLPVVMFSSRCERGVALSMQALSLGAAGTVGKPTTLGAVPDGGVLEVRDELIRRIKQIMQRARGRTIERILGNARIEISRVPGRPPMPRLTRAPLAGGASGVPGGQVPASLLELPPLAPAHARVEIVAIGASTGGPDALSVIIPALPVNLRVPVLIAQHAPPEFNRLLIERLSARASIPVREAQSGMLLEPGVAYLAPGDFHLIVVRDGGRHRLLTHQGPPENSSRPSVDVLFRSVSEVFGRHVLAIVVTGMGQDGTSGCQLLKRLGAQIIVQDEESSVVWGMPGSIAKEGLAERVLPLSQLAQEIVKRAGVRAREVRLEEASGAA